MQLEHSEYIASIASLILGKQYLLAPQMSVERVMPKDWRKTASPGSSVRVGESSGVLAVCVPCV